MCGRERTGRRNWRGPQPGREQLRGWWTPTQRREFNPTGIYGTYSVQRGPAGSLGEAWPATSRCSRTDLQGRGADTVQRGHRPGPCGGPSAAWPELAANEGPTLCKELAESQATGDAAQAEPGPWGWGWGAERGGDRIRFQNTAGGLQAREEAAAGPRSKRHFLPPLQPHVPKLRMPRLGVGEVGLREAQGALRPGVSSSPHPHGLCHQPRVTVPPLYR